MKGLQHSVDQMDQENFVSKSGENQQVCPGKFQILEFRIVKAVHQIQCNSFHISFSQFFLANQNES